MTAVDARAISMGTVGLLLAQPVKSNPAFSRQHRRLMMRVGPGMLVGLHLYGTGW